MESSAQVVPTVPERPQQNSSVLLRGPERQARVCFGYPKGGQHDCQSSSSFRQKQPRRKKTHEDGHDQGKNRLSGRVPVGRRSFVKGLGATGAALSGMAMLPRWSFADDYAAMHASAAIDWKQFSGQTITLAGAAHPWSKAITPLLQHFTQLTGIRVVTDFQSETKFLGALPIKLARGSTTPDVFMFLAYGQGISAGWLEPLDAYYSDKSLTDLAWYDEGDLLKTAQGFPLWSNGERYAVPITSEAMTLFMNSD